MRRLTAAATRLSALIVLAAVLFAVPAGAVALLGRVDDGSPGASWTDALTTGRLDDATVVRIGVILFVALWAWFAITALAEVARVVAARRHVGSLRPTASTPSGWVRHLVRVALVSSSAVMGGSMALLSVAAPLRTSAAATAPFEPAVAGAASSSASHVAGPSTLRSNGRETPYSVAVRLGDPALRDRVIELNRGARTPDGGSWSSGVFPAGMDVTVPAGLLQRDDVTWQAYTVDEGDSVYRIATRLAAGDHRRVRPLADRIIERNLGHVMNDGRVFDDPSLIRVGWQLEVPVPVVSGAAHTVQPGDSYWSIAADTLATDGQATPTDVLALTHELIDANAPRLGHDDPKLLVVGEVVTVPAPEAVHDAMVVVVELPATPAPPTSDPVPETVPDTTLVTAPVVAAPTTITPTPTTTPATPEPVDRAAPLAAATGSPITSRLGAALLLCAGALGLVETRRRQQLRRATTHSVATEPTPAEVQTERTLRSLDAVRRAARLDLALRSAGHALAGSGGFVEAAITTADGGVTLLLDRAGRVPSAPWLPCGTDRWLLPAHVPDDDLIEAARLAGQPCPALVHLGGLVRDPSGTSVADDPQVFADLEAFGLTAVDAGDDVGASRHATELVTALATSVAMSPVGENVHVVAHGIDPDRHLATIDHARVDHADDLDEALDLAAAALGTTPTVIGGRRTFELRARGLGGETWEPVVVAVHGDGLDAGAAAEMVTLTSGGGRGLAVIADRPISGAGMVLRARADGWLVEPLDLVVHPVGVTSRDLAAVAGLVHASAAPLAETECSPSPLRVMVREPREVEPAWRVMVHLLGRVRVTDTTGQEVAFERGKALELVAWLSQHRERPTRGAARATLWETAVRDATFANVVSEARRALARAVPPAPGEEWMGRTLTDPLPLHDLVVTDADVLRRRRDAARGLPPAEAVDVLSPGVALVRGMPFAGTDYLWPDAEGITSSLVLLATGAAADLAAHYLALGDIEGVFRATGTGLEVLAGHEELIGLRMQAHARRGDLAGVRHEWQAYERALVGDTWSACDPSPKLVALRRQLLTN